ncbi:hypothetical protein [Nocardia sp. NPDC049149]|uniref:hypothetical protein n=1 Tax=Nocardia sp. NPDC049149 TaxID=3364315 RepID=UPI0037115B6F
MSCEREVFALELCQHQALLAEDLCSVGSMMDGGHQHIEYCEDFGYLREDSAPLVLISPHGGMPRL